MTGLSGLPRKVLQKEQRISRETKGNGGNGKCSFMLVLFNMYKTPQCLDDLGWYSDNIACIFSQISVQCIGCGWVCKLLNLCSLLPEPCWWNRFLFVKSE